MNKVFILFLIFLSYKICAVNEEKKLTKKYDLVIDKCGEILGNNDNFKDFIKEFNEIENTKDSRFLKEFSVLALFMYHISNLSSRSMETFIKYLIEHESEILEKVVLIGGPGLLGLLAGFIGEYTFLSSNYTSLPFIWLTNSGPYFGVACLLGTASIYSCLKINKYVAKAFLMCKEKFKSS